MVCNVVHNPSNMYQKEFQWFYDKLFTNIHDLRSGVSSGKRLCSTYFNSSVPPGSSGAQYNTWWQHVMTVFADLKKMCGSYWKTLTIVPFLFEAVQFKGRMRFRVIIHHERVSQCTGLGSGWVGIIGTSVFSSWRLLKDGWRTQTKGSWKDKAGESGGAWRCS